MWVLRPWWGRRHGCSACPPACGPGAACCGLPPPPTHPCQLPCLPSGRYITAIQLTSQHLLRYLAVAVVVNKRRRTVLKDLLRVISQVGGRLPEGGWWAAASQPPFSLLVPTFFGSFLPDFPPSLSSFLPVLLLSSFPFLPAPPPTRRSLQVPHHHSSHCCLLLSFLPASFPAGDLRVPGPHHRVPAPAVCGV